MNSKKKKNLEETYERIINVGLCIVPYEDLSDLASPEIMLFGTTKDEKIFSFSELDAMFKSQYEQMVGFVPSLDRKRLFTRFSNDGNNAFISEEVTLTISSPEEVNTIFIRASCVMEYIDNRWKITHWHASTPVDTENDHWHMEEWKREKEKLQKLVDQQTADLHGKNRELEIEASIERVRAVTMGMTKPEDMLKVCRVISDQLQQFGVEHIRNVQTAIINEQKGTYHNYQYFTPYDKESFEITEGHKNSTVQAMIDRMLESPDAFFTTSLTGEELATFRSYRKQENQFPDPLLDDTISLDGYFFSIGPGGLGITLYRPLNEDGLEIFKRFHSVFSLAYRRFRDIEKAEGQAREAQIQLALERVRARTMAMQNSDELMEVSMELFTQFKSLGELSDQFSIGIFDEDKQAVKIYATLDGEKFDEPLEVNRDYHQVSSEFWKSWKSNKKSMTIDLSGESLASYNSMRNSFIYPKGEKTFSGDRWVIHVAFFSHGLLSFSSAKHLPQETGDLLERFAKVFEQTYTRFLDLQKAEAQARESQIETALEKVRSRTMAMQKGEELQEVAVLLYKELIALGVENFVSCGYVEIDESTQKQYVWITSPGGDTMGLFYLPLTGDTTFDARYAAWKKKQPVFHQSVAGQVRSDHLEYAITTFQSKEAEEMVRSQFPAPTVFYCFNFSHGYLHIVGGSLLEKEEENLLARFTKVFEQTYTRFLDLQKAEEQAREARIEMSLEKIRSRTMGMQSSDELPEVANTLFLEVQGLGIPAWSSGFNILAEDKRSAAAWMSSEGTLQDPFTLRLYGEASFDEMGDFLRKNEPFMVQELGGEALQEHYKYMKTFPDLKPTFKKLEEQGLSLPSYQINHLCKFSHGFLLFITYEPVPYAHGIFIRFTSVFDQTYTRFLDLKKSEQRAREAEVDLSLERVRSQVTAMQTSSDLFDIVVNMRKEFVSLGHIADYFWHMSWLPDSYEMSMTSEDGNRIGMVISLPKFVHEQIPGLIDWEKGNEAIYVMALDTDEAWDYIENMNTHGHYEQVDPHAPTRDDIESIGGLTFIIARTSHGEIGFSLPGEVPHPAQEALDTLVRFAGVFDLAYQRFEDLQESERQARLILEERDRLEIALKELHATQDQLVQQEKLASLGQLTAGIAHEIKNPLNFVNNFSEVSLELLEEAREEVKSSPLSRGEARSSPQMELILEILDDIEANLRKIYEHGSRADDIVKSMLQHSRGGDGKMEPTLLNPLIKEYVNLAFHGMRASKEPINVDIDLQLDENVGEVPLIAEDFSRVILNLCNNAFDAMREKINSELNIQNSKFSPKLTVRTKSGNGKVMIEIEDNGPGIPDDIKGKILQPFFTTKKGTQGTGLGLSITNDIIKAHGGELSINSTSGSGSTFIITLKP